jgi:DNA-binding transcriptional LysR family regulator
VELRQVQYFLGVARAGTFSRAAEDLHVAKSALSKQIKLLEVELGAELLLRGPGRREVELTAAGEAFLADAVTIVAAMGHGRERVRDLSGIARGRASVIIAPGWDAWPGWQEMVTEFRRRHPELSLSVTQGGLIGDMLTAIGAGDGDLAVMADTEVPERPGLRVEVLHAEPVFVILPPGHRLAARDHIGLGELTDERWVLPPIERSLVTRLAGAEGFSPIIEDDAPSAAMVRELVLAGTGVAICGRSETEFYAPATSVLLEPEVTASVFIAYRSAYRTAATRAVRDYLRACFGWTRDADVPAAAVE